MHNSFDSKPIQESYPPCFRPNTQQQSLIQTQNKLTINNQEQEDPIPVIDLRRIDFSNLDEACTNWGIFRLVNHGIPLTLLTELRELAVRVFEIGFEIKQDLFGSSIANCGGVSYFWGTPALTPAGVALYKDQGIVNYNWVEGFNFDFSQPSDVDLGQHPLISDFRKIMEEYGVHQARVAKSIFDAMSQNLKLCEENECYLSPSTGLLRIYRYPRCFFDNPSKVWGMEVHTDSSVVTILNQYEVEGLQILSPKDSTWIDVKPIPNTLVVHLGDMMQAISDDKYKSVKHRVRLHRERERISIGYFVFPKHDYVIHSSKYKPFSYSDFRAQVQQDVKTLGVKVGLSRFKVND